MVRPRVIAIVGLAIVGVAAAVAVGGPVGLAIAFGAATAARMIEGRGWMEEIDRMPGRMEAMIGGAMVGLVALGAALVVSAPLAEAIGRGVEWSTLPVVRGSAAQAATLGLLVVAIAIAAELTMRRWVLERVEAVARRAGWGSGAAIAAGIAGAAAVEAAIAPAGGDRVGVAVTAVGLGVIYVAAGRRIAASATARVVFELGAVILQALRLVG